jgi:hypothetical protein
VSRSLRFSRWRRLPGARRILEQKLPTHGDTPQRFTVYLPGRLIEDAEALARLDGAAHAREYCERELARFLRAEVARRRVDGGPPESPLDEDLDALADELAGGAGPRRGPLTLRLVESDEVIEVEEVRPQLPAPVDAPRPPAPVESPEGGNAGESLAAAAVRRHAGLAGGGASAGWLEYLRRGEAPPAEAAAGLLAALRGLEAGLRGASSVDRSLGHALFRLGLESQVLMTDAWPGLAADPGTVAVVLEVQELAERVMSGLDVRHGGPGGVGGER